MTEPKPDQPPPSAVDPVKPAPAAPFPHRNLGPHLKRPTSGEYVTDHHRSARKPKR